MTEPVPSALLFLFCFCFPAVTSISTARDAIYQTQPIKDGDTLVSASGRFILGFFTPERTKGRYLGIWYSFSPETVVWVANRQNPVADSSGVLNLTTNGTFLLSQMDKPMWSSEPTSMSIAQTPVRARLLDSGNLVITAYTSSSNEILWQSFDHPTDTMLPTAKLGVDFATGRNWTLLSWKGTNDPYPGDYSCSMDRRGLHEIYVKRMSTSTTTDNSIIPTISFRLGPWNGIRFSGVPRMTSYGSGMFAFAFVHNDREAFYSFNVTDKSTVARLVVTTDGIFRRMVWSEDSNPKGWTDYWNAPSGDCDAYGKCGPNGVCDEEDMGVCQCYSGYQPKSMGAWKGRDFRQGCERKARLNCSDVGFLTLEGVKLPDATNATVDERVDHGTCAAQCTRNCSCTAYAAADVRNQSGCIMWFGDLIDTRKFRTGGQELYLKLPPSESGQDQPTDKNKHKVVALTVSIVVVVVATSCVYLIWKRREKKGLSEDGEKVEEISHHEIRKWQEVIPLLTFATIASATDNFSVEKRIGKGGFGHVYKGIMEDGQEVAAKRLSRASGQGLDEFMNEVMLIARLQHRNLVRLVGCCIEKEERILVYEYMKNKSLDAFIFGKESNILLDWRKRLDIILGIARGLVYLHEDSRLKVIHRDLKAANILLDEVMNPKISDFGTARIFGVDDMELNTRRVIGTYGYMSPEYAMDGIFSVKSDVFSFGVLVLEIISGMRNTVFYHEEHDRNLIELAWRLWNDGRSLELVDKTIKSPYPASEVTRCIQISLLCVQECAADRPLMSSVVLMLGSETSPLPEPTRPGICKGKSSFTRESQSSCSQSLSNQVTITKLEAR